MDKPRGRPCVPRSAGNVVIFPGIRRREPTLHISLQLVACQTPQYFITWQKMKINSRFDLFMSLASRCMITNARSDTEAVHVAKKKCTKRIPDIVDRCFSIYRERR